MFANALQAAGAATSSLIVNVSRQGLVFIPMLFILNSVFGVTGLVIAQPVADITSFILSIIFHSYVSKKLFTSNTGNDNKKSNTTAQTAIS